MHEIKDITIIGGGPTGLFASFYAGMRGATAQIVDTLPQLGGQLTALYPEKYIFDVAGFPKILAKDLVRDLAEQAGQFGFPSHLGQHVMALEEEDGHFVLVTETDRFPTRSVLVAAGIGAFSPRRLPQQCAEAWYGRGIFDNVVDPEKFRGQKIVIIGGGDSAFDWCHQLRDRAASVTLVHRSDKYRAHGATVAEVQAAVDAGKTVLLPFHELNDVLSIDGTLSGIVVKDVKTKETKNLEADVILPMLGFISDIGPLAEWGLTLEKNEIVVNSMMETGRPGIYAAGDITAYPGKLKLILSGFHEGALMAQAAFRICRPNDKLRFQYTTSSSSLQKKLGVS
jgi:thioredoxin reductase (NADPH)